MAPIAATPWGLQWQGARLAAREMIQPDQSCGFLCQSTTIVKPDSETLDIGYSLLAIGHLHI